MNPVELKMRRRVVHAFIHADPVHVILVRATKTVKTPSGGWTTVKQPPLAPQLGRIVPAKRRYGFTGVNTEAGSIPLWPYNLLGLSDMDIQSGDTFVHSGDTYEVKSIEPDREERTVASIDFYGGQP